MGCDPFPLATLTVATLMPPSCLVPINPAAPQIPGAAGRRASSAAFPGLFRQLLLALDCEGGFGLGTAGVGLPAAHAHAVFARRNYAVTRFIDFTQVASFEYEVHVPRTVRRQMHPGECAQ